MGTRNLTIVVLNNEVKVAQYGQFDGYPSGRGATILEFLRNVNLEDFKTKVATCSWASKQLLESAFISVGSTDGSLTMSQLNELEDRFPQFYRNTGSEILSLIMLSYPNGIKLKNDYDFAGNSLFCEYCYVVDLDKETFEVYLGFNQTPLDEGDRFYGLDGGNGYQPVKLAKTYSLNDLPDEDSFIKYFSDLEDYGYDEQF